MHKPNIIWERINDDNEWCWGVVSINIGTMNDTSEFDEREVELVKGNVQLNNIVTEVFLKQKGENKYFEEKDKIIGSLPLSNIAKC